MAPSKPTLADAGLLIVRITGAFLAVHGWDKVHSGVTDSKWEFVEGVRNLGFPLPYVFAWAAALSEFVGGCAVALGIYTRCAAFAAASTMFVAAFIRHSGDAFGTKEKALLYLAVMLGLTFTGGGRLTIDSFWRKG